MSKRPEILAPAGDEASLQAAIAAGADAVYFGLKAWSARARATNFGDDALGAAMDALHRHGRRGYVAINTLVFDTKAAAQLVCGAGDYRILNSVFAYHNMEGGERAFTATFGLDQEGTKTKVLIANCVFYRLPGAVFGFSAATQPLLYNNFFYDFPDVFCYWGANQYFSPSELPEANQTENQTVDPNFSDAAAGDFHPASGSPLLEAGTTGNNAPGFDLLLEQRSGSNTVGVFQNASSGTVQPVPSSSTTITQ
jgi:hypothetical protein